MEQFSSGSQFFDVLVVGGGHAGLEAAWMASSFDLNVGLISLPGVMLGSTPCNPAVGGVGKGQVVREIDSLGGLMARVADLSAIQYRTLNESKGYAVQSTRVQVDKDLYSKNATDLIQSSSVKVIRDKVVNFLKQDDGFFKIICDQNILYSKKLVMTTGTFLGGKLHVGDREERGGRVDCHSSNGLKEIFSSVQTAKSRFKTGTPPRLKKSSINFNVMKSQPSDDRALNFHYAHDPTTRSVKQISCHLTHTTAQTLRIIRDNKSLSPMYNGQIKAIGPRYCPSIEDKAFRYPDKDEHHVFVEPETLDGDSVYPNGISTSLPVEIQENFLKTIPGFEDVEILIPGYAVEYDVVDTTKLDKTLQYVDIPGLYFAGQVNGTSGYEEAAGQGLVAGVNASLSVLDKGELILNRFDSYIGVMVEDLVTTLRDEPYRLFTARSESRLYVREDNAFVRMAPYRLKLGLNDSLDNWLKENYDLYKVTLELCSEKKYRDKDTVHFHFQANNYGKLTPNMSLRDLVKRMNSNLPSVLQNEVKEMGLNISESVIRSVAISLKYDGYIERAKAEEKRMGKLNTKKIGLKNILNNTHISNECRQRIADVRPETFGELKRIEGLRPATLVYIAGTLS